LAEARLKAWETLFRRALEIIDSARASGTRFDDWSFGGGTVLMRRFRHRVSKDVDIFVPDPQHLGYVSPRLNDVAESLAPKYLESANSLKLFFPEGEIDFIASAPLTKNPAAAETVLERKVQVETTAEIIAKKVWHRGREFTARDIFDLATVAKRDPDAIESIAAILRERRDVVRKRIASDETALRKTFTALDTLDFRPSYDECVRIVRDLLGKR
jgi:predicted nucleotidyltransferase component of viral defense system